MLAATPTPGELQAHRVVARGAASSARFVAGFIYESLNLDHDVELLRRTEGLVGYEVNVAAECGLARRADVSQVWGCDGPGRSAHPYSGKAAV